MGWKREEVPVYPCQGSVLGMCLGWGRMWCVCQGQEGDLACLGSGLDERNCRGGWDKGGLVFWKSLNYMLRALMSVGELQCFPNQMSDMMERVLQGDKRPESWGEGWQLSLVMKNGGPPHHE